MDVTDERLPTARGAYTAGAISSAAAAMSLALFAETCPSGRTHILETNGGVTRRASNVCIPLGSRRCTCTANAPAR
jgi:hypothetical protein